MNKKAETQTLYYVYASLSSEWHERLLKAFHDDGSTTASKVERAIQEAIMNREAVKDGR